MVHRLLSILLIFLLVPLIYSIDPSDIKIPSKYVTDPDFISMIGKSPEISHKLYASPKGSGDSCTNSKPCKISTAFDKMEDEKKYNAIYLKSGTYDVHSGIYINFSGSANSYKVISSAPGEKATITSSKSGENEDVPLFQVDGSSSYIIIENLTFANVKAMKVQGIAFYEGGQHHVIIRNNVFESLKTTAVDEHHGANGILLEGETKVGIKQVIIYKNKIMNNVLGYSEALSVAGNCEHIYVLDNEVKDNTNIGIDFNGNEGYCETPELDQPRNSVAMYNYIEKSSAKYASCAGLYVDGARDIYLAENTVVKSQYGIEIGAEEDVEGYPVKNIIVKNNKLKDNTETGLRIGGFDKEESGIVKDSEIIGNTISGSNTAVIISIAQSIDFKENEIVGADKLFVDIEFSSTYAKDIGFEKNVFSGKGQFRLYGKKPISLDEFIKLYPSNKKK